ncbi:MAG: bifunctional 2-C-methyl-D-erythritol 4-phosphate cytidylyltransferase/2-C-methyl-D-erythritol 2,4-cyclodiphosphate synthase, partial [Alphaproteobacteria bacterium]
MSGPQKTVAALIVAAGKGMRAGGGVPKQYRALAGRTLLAHALVPFLRHDAVGRVLCVIGDGQQRLFEQACAGLADPLGKLAPPVFGGA